ncbi:MAG: thrombospondin type 3 repeat-containing protein, partial [Lentisphaeria bacterium]|nr:thrombospondin type 3 repeat-containing protein [Lentisphaeria bacterium]
MKNLRFFLFMTLGTSLLFGVHCKSVPTSVLLEVRSRAGLPQPDALKITVFDSTKATVSDRRLPEKGSPTLPSTVVLFPKKESGRLRILVRARDLTQVIGEGTTEVTLQAGSQVSAVVTIEVGKLPDRDGDGVPDTIDNCPDLPNPTQTPCRTDGGPSDATHDGLDLNDLDLSPLDTTQDALDLGDFSPADRGDDLPVYDLNCDRDKDGYLSTACGGKDCNDL